MVVGFSEQENYSCYNKPMILLSPMPPCRSLAMLDPWLDHSPKTNMPNNCLLDDRKTKICLPCQAANDLAKTRAYPTLAPLLLLKKNAAGYVSIAVLKPCQIKKGLKYIWAAPKMVSFSATNCKKKDTIFAGAQIYFRLLLFDCFNSNNTYALSFC